MAELGRQHVDRAQRTAKYWRMGAVSVILAGFFVLSVLTQIYPPMDMVYGGDPPSDSETATTSVGASTPDASAPSTDVPADEESPPTEDAPVWDPLAALNGADMAWVLTATGLVLLMTPGVAFFYGGMVQSKNVISTIMQCFITLGVISVLWIFLGFSLAFGADCGGFIGNPATYYFFTDVGAAPSPELAPTIPLTLFAMFQLTFAIITPALITGSFAERCRFYAFVPFTVLWHIFVYCPMAHMVWTPDGLMRKYYVMDFAGGTVVHMTSGWAALVGAWFLGPRRNRQDAGPSSVPFVLLGTALLWFGWFGFNAGSALGANWLACQALLTTNTCAAASMVTWILLDYLREEHVKATSACAGAIVGLVVITPACGFVTVGSALLMGIIGALCCYATQLLFSRYLHRLDDRLDAFPCHGMGGTVGMILTSCFATTDVNSAGWNGLFYGGGTVFWHTLVAVISSIAYIIIITYFCFKITDLVVTMRASDEEEEMGLDITQHGERYKEHQEHSAGGHGTLGTLRRKMFQVLGSRHRISFDSGPIGAPGFELASKPSGIPRRSSDMGRHHSRPSTDHADRSSNRNRSSIGRGLDCRDQLQAFVRSSAAQDMSVALAPAEPGEQESDVNATMRYPALAASEVKAV